MCIEASNEEINICFGQGGCAISVEASAGTYEGTGIPPMQEHVFLNILLITWSA